MPFLMAEENARGKRIAHEYGAADRERERAQLRLGMATVAGFVRSEIFVDATAFCWRTPLSIY